MIICLETATNLCSVALCDRKGIVAARESDESKSHSALLTVYIRDLLRESGIRAADLEAVAVSRGPGSYTGLRIGISAAKGMAFAASIPLIGVETLFSMYHGIMEIKGNDLPLNTLFCPMIDARRMEVYYTIYDTTGRILKNISAGVIDRDSFRDIPESHKIVFFGDGAAKCKNVITRGNIQFYDDYRISASHMSRPAFKALEERQFEDIAYSEPLYLKDFITTKPRKNILEL
jgi:tRNA threonylcarbamoyladenosine biosynthesis protein TsaB